MCFTVRPQAARDQNCLNKPGKRPHPPTFSRGLRNEPREQGAQSALEGEQPPRLRVHARAGLSRSPVPTGTLLPPNGLRIQKAQSTQRGSNSFLTISGVGRAAGLKNSYECRPLSTVWETLGPVECCATGTEKGTVRCKAPRPHHGHRPAEPSAPGDWHAHPPGLWSADGTETGPRSLKPDTTPPGASQHQGQPDGHQHEHLGNIPQSPKKLHLRVIISTFISWKQKKFN